MSGLDWKLVTEEERNQVKFIWEDCLPIEFLHYTLEEEIYKTLGVLNLNYQKCTEIVTNYLKQDESRLPPLIEAVRNNLVVFRYAFATLFPKSTAELIRTALKKKLRLNTNITTGGIENTMLTITNNLKFSARMIC